MNLSCSRSYRSYNWTKIRCCVVTCAVLGLFLGSENARAGQCLDRNNDNFSMAQGDVYTNGKLKLRINGWTINHARALTAADIAKMSSKEIDAYASAAGHNDLDMRSNAAGFNGGGFDDTGFKATDRGNLCSGVELTLVCRLNQSTWSCRVSEY